MTVSRRSLAGQDTALAEGAAGMNGAEQLPRLLGKIHPHFRLAGGQQVQPVWRVTLPKDHVAAGERRMDHALADGPQFLFLQAGKQFQLAQIGMRRSISRRWSDSGKPRSPW
jgi:hypothetical protein